MNKIELKKNFLNYFKKVNIKKDDNIYITCDLNCISKFRIPKRVKLEIIYESFKSEDNFIVALEKLTNKDRLSSNDSENEKKVLGFY